MKFGSKLKDAICPEWREYYIDYDGLKKRLRKAEKDRPFTEKDETEFVEDLDSNLEKIYAFHQQKLEEIESRIDSWAEVLGSQPPASEMGRIQENINQIADDVNRLAHYSRLNYTGFLKIIKKHDRHTNYILRPMFMVRLNQCPFWKQDDDPLLIKLSELFAQARHGGGKETSYVRRPSKPNLEEDLNVDNSTNTTTSSKKRRTIIKRFFVHTDNIMELKTAVLRHLPVLVYRDQRGSQEDIDPPISSLYLDTSGLDLYNACVETAEGSQIVRLRWYGSANDKNTYINLERRTWNEAYGEQKEQLTMKEKYIDGFLKGDKTFIEKSITKMKNNLGKSEQDVEQFEELAKDIQEHIMDQHLQPVLRTYYRRTAFQIPGDNRVRMALDTDLCFIREDSQLFQDDATVRRPSGCWRRPDVDTEFPFRGLQENEINRYPYATFEIKLDLPPGTPEPEWIIDLEESGMLEEAENFNKFVHGVAMLFDTRVALLPYWLAQIEDEELLQHEMEKQSAQEYEQDKKGKGKASIRNESPPSSSSAAAAAAAGLPPPPPNERTSLLGGHRGGSYMGTMDTSASARREQQEEEEEYEDWTNKVARLWQDLFQRDSKKKRYPPVVLPPGVKVPKKVVSPLRVEPKVFFANERTYFAWMSLGSLMATFSIALFNAGDAVGKVSGIVYTLVSLTTLIYGMGVYYRRRELIRAKAPGPYDDTTGPTLICLALLFAVGLNAYLKFTMRSPTLLYF